MVATDGLNCRLPGLDFFWRIVGGKTDNGNLHAFKIKELYVLMARQLVAIAIAQICCENRELSFGHAFTVNRFSKIEFMIANCNSVVSDCVESSNNGRALVEIRLERSLPHVTCVNEQYRATIASPGVSQVFNVSAKQRQASIAIDRQQAAVYVVCAENGKRNSRVLILRRLTACGQQQDPNYYGESNSHRLHRLLPLAGSRALYELTGTLVRHLTICDNRNAVD